MAYIGNITYIKDIIYIGEYNLQWEYLTLLI